MTASADILLLADTHLGAELQSQMPGTAILCRADPYDALVEMGRQPWSTVVVTAGREELAGLCRAARRLQRSARLVALCPPALEPQVRPMVGKTLDDYLIYPPTGRDLARLRRAAGHLDAPSDGLSARQFAELADAAGSVETLQAKVAEIVSQAAGEKVEWIQTAQLNGAHRPLLLAEGDEPRVLVASSPDEPAEPVQVLLAALRQCLPSLMGLARRCQGLQKLAISDHLTGAYNRRYFYHLTDRILLQSARKNLRATLLLWDIDNFKRYNDTYGYSAGDEILRDTVALMKHISRSHDIVARIGGDEFCVLFWDAEAPRSPDSQPPADAYALADRFRAAVARHEFPSLGPEAVGVLTISGGLASFPADGDNCRGLLRKANDALKAAKLAGKNGIQIVG